MFAQFFHECFACHSDFIEVDAHGIDVMACACAPGGLCGFEVWCILQRDIVLQRECGSACDELVEFFELCVCEGALYICDAVVVSEVLHFVVPGVWVVFGAGLGLDEEGVIPFSDTVCAQAQEVTVEGFIIGCDHTAFAGSDGFHGVEGEDGHGGVGAISDPAPVCVICAKRVRGVFDHDGAGLVCEGFDGRRITGQSSVVHGHNSGGIFGFSEGFCECIGAHINRCGVYIGKGDGAPFTKRCIGGGHEGDRAGDQCAPGFNASGTRGKVQRGGTAGHGHRKARAGIGCDISFKRFDIAPLS